MQSSKSNIRFLWITLLIVTAALSVVLQSGPVATAGPYADSAHGSNSYGVKHKDKGYDRGDCAHCHDTFDSSICSDWESGTNEYMLFGPPSDQDFCFGCHDGSNNYQTPAFDNYNYSATFGGGSADSTNVKAAFNASGSTHDLSDILSFAKSKGWVPDADNNPCLVCHNHHIAGPNKHNPDNPDYTTIRLPSAYSSTLEEDALWGDDGNEQLNDSWSPYQAPKYAGGDYEPGNTSSADGSKHPDYNTFCTNCHNLVNTIYSTSHGKNLKKVDWATEKHGKGNADCSICVDFPYCDDCNNKSDGYPATLGKVLSCLDCHEPHGSSNAFLIRTVVNGGTLGGIITGFSTTDWHWLCQRCHRDDTEITQQPKDNKYQYVHHWNQGPPWGFCNDERPYYGSDYTHQCHVAGQNCTGGRPKIECTDCHYHRSSATAYPNVSLTPETRVTF